MMRYDIRFRLLLDRTKSGSQHKISMAKIATRTVSLWLHFIRSESGFLRYPILIRFLILSDLKQARELFVTLSAPIIYGNMISR